MADLKAKKRSLASKIEGIEKKLAKMGPENKELMKTTSLLKECRSEMEGLKIDVLAEEAAIGDFKRRTTKEAMGLKCGGLIELAEKMTIVGEVGKMIIDQIPLDTTKPGMARASYHGHARTDQLLQDASRSVSDVGFAPLNAFHDGHRPDISHSDTDYQPDTQYGAEEVQEQNDLYAGSHTYDAAADVSQTPIYASHQTTQLPLNQADTGANSQPDLYNTSQLDQEVKLAGGADGSDNGAEDWGRGTESAVNGASGRPAHAYNVLHMADELPDPSQPWRSGVTGDSAPGSRDDDHTGDDIDLRASHRVLLTSTDFCPDDFQQQHLATSSAAPSLPPLRASSPLPGGTTTVSQQEMDDESYFAAVGSTRAAQAAARRPISPSATNRYNTTMSGSDSTNSLAAMGATVASQQGSATPTGYASYEPLEPGRKMTAAAFRKGFSRVPSSQQAQSMAVGDFSSEISSRDDATSPSVAPLAIRKRLSALPDADPRDDEAAPPYPIGEAQGIGLQPGQILNPNAHVDSSAAYDTHS